MEFENLYLETTRECSMCCEHCLRGNHEHKYMSIKTLENSLKDIKHINTLLLSGGEPLLSIYLLEHLPILIKKYNIEIDRIGIITNGTICSSRHINALINIKRMCKDFEFFLSFDLFHRLEWQRLGITDRVERNYDIYKEFLDIKKYPDKNSSNNFLIFQTGRAESITDTRLREIRVLNNINIKFNTEKDEGIRIYKNKVEGKACIDVYGNIVGYSKSFEEEDQEAREEHNVNKYSIRECVINYINRNNNKQYKKTLYS